MPYSLNYGSILAASLIAIALTDSPLSAHAPEYHAQPELNYKSNSAESKPTPEATPNSSARETSLEAATFSIDSLEQAASAAETCGIIHPETNPAAKYNSSMPPGISELLLGLLAIAPFAMVWTRKVKKRSHQ